MAPIPEVADLSQITKLELGILSAETVNQMVRVACTQDDSELGYSGGFLDIVSEACRVFDESDREWTLKELSQLSNDYWSESGE